MLEVGFDKTAPNQAKTITSWALNKAIASKAEVIENRATDVLCYEPKYTFVEKLQAVVRKFRRYKENDAIPKNFMRHYYDIYHLLKLKEVQEFIGTSEYELFKIERFGGDDIKISNSDAFKLSDKNDRYIFEKAYIETQSLYYQGQTTLNEIIEFISKYLYKL